MQAFKDRIPDLYSDADQRDNMMRRVTEIMQAGTDSPAAKLMCMIARMQTRSGVLPIAADHPDHDVIDQRDWQAFGQGLSAMLCEAKRQQQHTTTAQDEKTQAATRLVEAFRQGLHTAQPSLLRHCSRSGCAKAEKHALEFQTCSRCKQAFYCSRDCQSADWKRTHKRVCKTASVASTHESKAI